MVTQLEYNILENSLWDMFENLLKVYFNVALLIFIIMRLFILFYIYYTESLCENVQTAEANTSS